jgi:mono/diheme cytochrome c family protein
VQRESIGRPDGSNEPYYAGVEDTFATPQGWSVVRSWRVFQSVSDESTVFWSFVSDFNGDPASAVSELRRQHIAPWNGRYRGVYLEIEDSAQAIVQVGTILIITEASMAPFPYPELLDDAPALIDLAAEMTDISIDVIEETVTNASAALQATSTALISLGDVRLGQQQFQFQCVSCHQASGSGRGPALLGPNSPVNDITDQELFNLVRTGEGHEGQEPVSIARISDHQLASIIAYIRDELTSSQGMRCAWQIYGTVTLTQGRR